MNFLKKFETYINTLGSLEIEMENICSVEDVFYKAELLNVKNKGEYLILKIKLSEKNDKSFNGTGTFKYYPSKINTVIGDLTPIELNGIFEELWETENDSIVDLIFNLLNECKIH